MPVQSTVVSSDGGLFGALAPVQGTSRNIGEVICVSREALLTAIEPQETV